MGERVFVVRHAKALSRDEWKGDDCQRPLTEEGKREFEEFVSAISFIFPKSLKIVSSPCSRALETAEILSSCLNAEVSVDERLSPDAEPQDYLSVLEGVKGSVILVGHEPDISLFLNYLTCISPACIAFKKGAIAEIRKKNDKWKLFGFYNPSIFD